MKEQHRLAAIMFTDITGYSAMMSKDEKLAMHVLEKNRAIHKSAITKFNGEYIKEVKVPKTFIFLGIIVILALAVVWLVFLPPEHSEIGHERIAVAIFDNRTGDASMDELGIIAADLITQGLSRAVETDVVPTTTVMQLNRSLFAAPGERNLPDYLEKLAKTTKAGVIVSGSYYLQQDKLHFQAEIKNVRNGSIIYAFPATTGLVDQPLELIEKLSSEVIGGLALHFKVRDLQRVAKPPNIEAYREYIIGMELYSQVEEGAVQHLIRATNIDSLFFPPQFELAWWYQNGKEYARADSILHIINRNRERLTTFERHHLDGMLSFLSGKLDESQYHFRAAANISPGDWSNNIVVAGNAIFVNKPGIAVEIFTNSNLPGSHKPVGDFGAWQLDFLIGALHLLGNYKQELAATRNGQLYYPASFTFYMNEIRALAALGQIEEMKKVIDKCETLSSQTGPTFGWVLYTAARELRYYGHAREAQVYALKAVEWCRKQPQTLNVRRELSDALYLAKLWDEAQTLCDQMIAEFPDNIDYLGFLGLLAASRGDRDEAMIISERLRQIDRPYIYGSHTYHRAEIAAQLGEREFAVELLKESFAQGYIFMPHVKSNPAWEPLKDYPPFEELMMPKE